ncbi:MAG: DUF4266 domain-containing protein, partial [Deltaproteobacteria bacterium]|nr:DUF4266 domain-containing protein [Deltaproteobacteria bacterium]
MKFRALVIALCLALLGACKIVPKNRRQHLADPTMQPDEDRLRDKSHAKVHLAREGAAGGDGEPAGGGCGCSN